MPPKFRLLMRLGSMVVIGVALLGDLPGVWAIITGLIGVVMFFAGGPA